MEIADKTPEAKNMSVASWKENTLVTDQMWVVDFE